MPNNSFALSLRFASIASLISLKMMNACPLILIFFLATIYFTTVTYVDDLTKLFEYREQPIFESVDGDFLIEITNIESIIGRILYLVAGLYANLTVNLPVVTAYISGSTFIRVEGGFMGFMSFIIGKSIRSAFKSGKNVHQTTDNLGK